MHPVVLVHFRTVARVLDDQAQFEMIVHHYTSIYDGVSLRFAGCIIRPRIRVLANKSPCRRMHYFHCEAHHSLVSAVHHSVSKPSKMRIPSHLDAKNNRLYLMYISSGRNVPFCPDWSLVTDGVI